MVIPCRSPVSATSFFWVIPRISHAPRHKRVTGIAIFRLKVPPFEDAKAWLTSNRPDPSSFGLGSFGDFHHKNCEKNWGYHEIWMEYQWDINGIQWEYWWIPSGVIKHGLLESSPFSSMISQGTKPPRLGDFQWQRCRTYQILLHLESGHQPSAVHVATSLASQHCYVYRGTGVTPGYTTKKKIHPGNVRSSFLFSSYLPVLDTIECSKILTERNESWKCWNCPCWAGLQKSAKSCATAVQVGRAQVSAALSEKNLSQHPMGSIDPMKTKLPRFPPFCWQLKPPSLPAPSFVPRGPSSLTPSAGTLFGCHRDTLEIRAD